MIVKAVVLFLIAMLALGMFGKLRRPTLPRRRSRGGDVAVRTARKCPVCDTYMIGSAEEGCGRPDCPSRRRT